MNPIEAVKYALNVLQEYADPANWEGIYVFEPHKNTRLHDYELAQNAVRKLEEAEVIRKIRECCDGCDFCGKECPVGDSCDVCGCECCWQCYTTFEQGDDLLISRFSNAVFRYCPECAVARNEAEPEVQKAYQRLDKELDAILRKMRKSPGRKIPEC